MAIRSPSIGERGQSAFVVSLADMVTSQDTYDRLRNAEQDYMDHLDRWKRQVQSVKKERSNPARRWKLGDSILSFQRKMRLRWRLRPTNLLEAVSRDLELSDSALGYTLRLRQRFTLDEIHTLGFGWSKFQEILDIKDDTMMRKCALLIKKGRLKHDEDIREFKRTANAGRSAKVK